MTCDLCQKDSAVFDFGRECCISRHKITMSREAAIQAHYLTAAAKSASGDHAMASELVEKHPELKTAMRKLVLRLRKERAA